MQSKHSLLCVTSINNRESNQTMLLNQISIHNFRIKMHTLNFTPLHSDTYNNGILIYIILIMLLLLHQLGSISFGYFFSISIFSYVITEALPPVDHTWGKGGGG